MIEKRSLFDPQLFSRSSSFFQNLGQIFNQFFQQSFVHLLTLIVAIFRSVSSVEISDI